MQRVQKPAMRAAAVGSTTVLHRLAALYSRAYTTGVHPEVQAALSGGKAVVALESTIISHGMPYPANLECARRVEAEVRAQGAVPATCAIIAGKPYVGLDDTALEHLAQAGESVRKCSRRDLASVMAAGGDGATTVSGTMVLAHHAGIKVFATGGIGGVHRGAETSLDISADLTELGRTPLCVVCAGVKSILDIGLTLEYLETQGVAVATLGPPGVPFPAFFTPESPFPSPSAIPDVAHAASQLYAASSLGLSSGMVLAVPNPSPPSDAAAVQAAVEQALREASQKAVEGKDVTPFLLARVTKLTGGDSLASNIELVLNNARTAAELAVELCAIQNAAQHEHQLTPSRSRDCHDHLQRNTGASSMRVVIVGGATMDVTSKPSTGRSLLRRTSNPGVVTQRPGGVARNIAEAISRAARTDCSPLLISAVGNDLTGAALVSACAKVGIDVNGVRRGHDTIGCTEESRTAVYMAMLEETGELVSAVADMSILDTLSATDIYSFADDIATSSFVVTDANTPAEALGALGKLCTQHNLPLWYEPTSVPKAGRLWAASAAEALNATRWLSPNLDELHAIGHAARHMLADQGLEVESEPVISALKDVETQISSSVKIAIEDNVPAVLHSLASANSVDGSRNIIITLGDDGIIWLEAQLRSGSWYINATKLDAAPVSGLHVSVTGCGDTLVGATIAGIASGNGIEESLQQGLRAAALTLQSDFAVSPELSNDADI